MLLFCLGFVFYAIGYSNIVNLFEQNAGETGSRNIHVTNSTDPVSVNSLIYDFTGENLPGDIQNTDFVIGAIIVALTLGGGAAILLNNFSTIYVTPLLILVAILGLNVFIFPIDFIFAGDVMPVILKLPIVALFNMLTILAVIDFIRGGA